MLGDKQGGGRRVVALTPTLKVPNGVAWRDGALYVAEINRRVAGGHSDRLHFSSLVRSLHKVLCALRLAAGVAEGVRHLGVCPRQT